MRFPHSAGFWRYLGADFTVFWPASLSEISAKLIVRRGIWRSCQRSKPSSKPARRAMDHMRAELCCDALNMALGRRGPVPGLVHHSDRGSQYAGGDYRKLIEKAGLTQSMCRKGECLDTAPMESFFASLKKELVDLRP